MTAGGRHSQTKLPSLLVHVSAKLQGNWLHSSMSTQSLSFNSKPAAQAPHWLARGPLQPGGGQNDAELGEDDWSDDTQALPRPFLARRRCAPPLVESQARLHSRQSKPPGLFWQ